jgi:energy-coupling factor transporter ATP-binding protein EcfA2
MKFHSLKIVNLRAIRQFGINDLGSFVVVAGQNGSGKSCVFDAIQLLKSVYGGYSANEYHQWFGEFQINLQDRSSLSKLFRTVDKPIQIEASVSFSPEEEEYLSQHAEPVVQPIAWQEVTALPVDYWTFTRAAVATQLRQHQPALADAISRLADEVRSAVIDPLHTLKLEIVPGGEISIAPSKFVEVAFQAYAPDNLGVIEYHSASRSYSRQPVGGIDLNARSFEDQRR